jgi:hypothetical protein
MPTEYLTRLAVLGTLIAEGEAAIMELVKTLATLAEDDPRHAQLLGQLHALSEQQQRAFVEQLRLTKAALAALKGKSARRKGKGPA